MRSCARFGLAILLLAVLVPHARAQSGHDLFQQALVSERNDGDLQQAIALYRRIADEYAADRQLTARALLRLGGVYELLGSAEATATFNRLVRDFADQETEVAEARARLAALSPDVAPAQGGLPTRRLIIDLIVGGAPIDDGGVVDAKPTPDGRHLMRYDWERRAFESVAIESNGATHLTPQSPDTTRSWQPEHAFVDKLSPDGRLIASVVRVRMTGDSPTAPTDTGRKELRVFDVGNPGEGRPLFAWDPSDYSSLFVFGWSPDQHRLWVWGLRPDGSRHIASVRVRDGSFEVLKTVTWRFRQQGPSLSPDGRFIAFHDADTRDGPPDVFLLATDGSREVRVEHPASDSKPIFTPDGSGVVFDSNRRGVRDLWFLPVVDGRPAGEPRIVFEDIFPFNGTLEFGDNGSLFYYVGLNGWEIYTADIDLAAGTVRVPERIELRHGEMNTAPAYSPDGRFLAHLRKLGRRLVIRELATGAEREFPIRSLGSWASIDWCPGNNAVIVTGFQNEYRAVRVNLEHGGAERLPLAEPVRVVCVGDGDDIVYVRPQSRTGRRRIVQVVRRSLATGAESILATGPFGTSLSRSPDAKSIAFFRDSEIESQKQKELLVMPSSGGEAISVATFPLFEGVNPFFSNIHGHMWLPDGNALLVASVPDRADMEEASPEVTLRRVPLGGGPVSVVGRMGLPAFARAIFGSLHYSLHPDGSRIAFTRHAGTVSEVWAIDNLMQFIQSGESLPIASPLRR